MKTKTPSEEELVSELGPASIIWDQVTSLMAERFGPIEQEWKPSKLNFGWMCLFKKNKRTLLYMTPDAQTVRVAIVLGERAAGVALASKIPDEIKGLIRDARPYAEGRGIRFKLTSSIDANVACDLIEIKTMPK